MNISFNWLKKYIDFELSPEETSDALTSLGLEVGSIKEIESIKGGLKGLVIGKVLTCENHENSDHLHITTVDVGTESPLQIVCGAPNIKQGQTVVVATIGTIIYSGDDEFKIKKNKIRGVESNGMICSALEIGVGTSNDGIIVLNENIKPGTLASDYYNIKNDIIFEVDITPNRVEAASHFGIARDLACFLKQNKNKYNLKKPDISDFKTNFTDEIIKIEIEDKEKCPRYSGLYIKNVKVEESPDWLKEKLSSIGLRSINSVVDITNFVLHELGHPLHAFDADKIEGNKIIIKTEKEGTKFVTLDEIERTISSSDLMICDTKKPLCIAGVLGGSNSGVNNSTKNIFLECAYFNPTSVRKTARRHGINTDSSFRFERGVDPNDNEYILKRAALLIQDIAGGEIVGNIQDAYPTKIENKIINISYDKINNLIGKSIDKDHLKSIFESLEIIILTENNDELTLSIPTYRVDILRDVDVIEEILRIYGYNNIETDSFVKSNLSYKSRTDRSYDLQNVISHLLVGAGFYEILNNSLSSEKYYQLSESFTHNNSVKLLNALSSDLNTIRQTLLFGGLESIAYNTNRKISEIKFFEFGNTYTQKNTNQDKENINELSKFSEGSKLSLWLMGDAFQNSWNYQTRNISFYDLKAIVENILHALKLRNNYSFEIGKSDIYTNSLILSINNKQVGSLGIVHSKISKAFGILGDVFFAELDWDKLMKASSKKEVIFKETSKHPIVERDFALLVNKDVEFEKIKRLALNSDKKLIKDVVLFDVYEGENLPSGKKSYAIKFYLQNNDATLTDKQIDAIMQKIYKSIEKEIEVQLR